MTSPPARVDRSFVGHAALEDGTPVLVRLLRPQDRPLLEAGFARLSPQSRYRRFLGGKAALSEADLRYLVDIDQVDHVAVGALLDRPGEPQGLGVGRFVRLAGHSDVAEAAVAVIDAYQGKGLGRILLRVLVAAAQERGIRWFRSTVLFDNDPIRQLVASLAPTAETHFEPGGLLRIDVPVPPEPVDLSDLTTPTEPTPLRRLLALAAGEAVRVLLQTLGLRSED